VDINEIINKKTKNNSLSKEEIFFVVSSYNNSKINDAKMIEFMNVVNENNFSYEETYYLAEALADTGIRLNISEKVGFVVDKHSAGSVSDPVSLLFMSILAALDIKNVKVLSKDFGDYGNSLSRFKMFKNFSAKISEEELCDNIKSIGVGLYEEVGQIAPLDKKLYKLRKKANIQNIPFISASILAKKLATGASAYIFDVKTGEGAILPDEQFAYTLAEFLVNTSKIAGVPAVSVVTNCNQPLGCCVGGRVELEETISALRIDNSLYDANLLDIVRELVIVTLCLIKRCKGRMEASELFDEAIKSGLALIKFKQLIHAYGGEYQDFKHSAQILLDGVTVSYITAKDSGYVYDINLKKLVNAYQTLTKGKDKNAGIVVLVREGQKVNVSDKLVRVLYSFNNSCFCESVKEIKDSIVIEKNKPAKNKIFYKIVL